MRKKNIMLMLLGIALTVAGCATGGSGNSVTVETADGHKVRLTAISDRIIRVSATADRFSTDSSLIVVRQSEQVECCITSTDSSVSLTTKAVSATVSKATGEVVFCDARATASCAKTAAAASRLRPSPSTA